MSIQKEEIGIRLRHRRDSLANWIANNPILEEGELGFEYNTEEQVCQNFKIGDGKTRWCDLPYAYYKDDYAPKNHASTTIDYGIATNKEYGHVRITGSSFENSWAISQILLDGTISNLNDETFLQSGEYSINFYTDDNGAPTTIFEDTQNSAPSIISGILKTYSLMPEEGYNSPAKQLLIIPSYSLTYERYIYKLAYGDWYLISYKKNENLYGGKLEYLRTLEVDATIPFPKNETSSESTEDQVLIGKTSNNGSIYFTNTIEPKTFIDQTYLFGQREILITDQDGEIILMDIIDHNIEENYYNENTENLAYLNIDTNRLYIISSNGQQRVYRVI